MSNFVGKTGDVELDVARRIVQRLAAVGVTDVVLVGSGKNLWTSSEAPPDGQVGSVGTFVEITGGRNPGTNDSLQREFDVQVLERFVPGPQRREEKAARARIHAVYEALHRTGEFVGDSTKARYVEMLAVDVPVLLEPRYFVVNFTLYRDG